MKATQIVLTAAVAASSLFIASPAQAYGTPGCVTKKEFRTVKHGFSKTRVHRIFAAKGKQTSVFWIGGDKYEGREYKTCNSRYGFVAIDFEDNLSTHISSRLPQATH